MIHVLRNEELINEELFRIILEIFPVNKDFYFLLLDLNFTLTMSFSIVDDMLEGHLE